MADVTWCRHPVYEFYEVSNDGRVRSVDRYVTVRGSEYHSNSIWTQFVRGRELAGAYSTKGYRVVAVSVEGRITQVSIHRMVCEAFHGLSPFPDAHVRHLNGRRTDNRPENLAWGTRSENAQDTVRHGAHHQVNKTHCPRGHALTEDNIYRRTDRPWRHRECLTCKRVRDRESSRVRYARKTRSTTTASEDRATQGGKP